MSGGERQTEAVPCINEGVERRETAEMEIEEKGQKENQAMVENKELIKMKGEVSARLFQCVIRDDPGLLQRTRLWLVAQE